MHTNYTRIALASVVAITLLLSAACAQTVAPVATAVPAAPTSPPAATPVPEADTPVPPADTPVPPTNTPVPVADTPVPATDTPEPAEPTQAPAEQPAAALDGLEILQMRCTQCHALDKVVTQQRTAEQWAVSVKQMAQYGSEITEEERVVLVEYLAATYGPSETVAFDGEQLLLERCTVCHDLGRVRISKRDEQGWKGTLERMVGNGAQLSPEELDALAAYLAGPSQAFGQAHDD